MDDASLAALRRTTELALDRARRELARRHDALIEANAERGRLGLARSALQSRHARWEESVRALVGHTLSARELLDLRRQGAALEAGLTALAARHAEAGAGVGRAAEALEEARRASGELLARQRWTDEEWRRGHETRARKAALREDED